MNNTFVTAKLNGFTCPNCITYSNHNWAYDFANETRGYFNGSSSQKGIVEKLCLCKCQHRWIY